MIQKMWICGFLILVCSCIPPKLWASSCKQCSYCVKRKHLCLMHNIAPKYKPTTSLSACWSHTQGNWGPWVLMTCPGHAFNSVVRLWRHGLPSHNNSAIDTVFHFSSWDTNSSYCYLFPPIMLNIWILWFHLKNDLTLYLFRRLFRKKVVMNCQCPAKHFKNIYDICREIAR